MNTTYKNVTPHPVRLANAAGEVILELPPSGVIARVEEVEEVVGVVNGITEVVYPIFGQVLNLPAPEPGVIYIASAMVAQAARRPDVVSPGTGASSVVRDERGQILAVRKLRSWYWNNAECALI